MPEYLPDDYTLSMQIYAKKIKEFKEFLEEAESLPGGLPDELSGLSEALNDSLAFPELFQKPLTEDIFEKYPEHISVWEKVKEMVETYANSGNIPEDRLEFHKAFIAHADEINSSMAPMRQFSAAMKKLAAYNQRLDTPEGEQEIFDQFDLTGLTGHRPSPYECETLSLKTTDIDTLSDRLIWLANRDQLVKRAQQTDDPRKEKKTIGSEKDDIYAQTYERLMKELANASMDVQADVAERISRHINATQDAVSSKLDDLIEIHGSLDNALVPLAESAEYKAAEAARCLYNDLPGRMAGFREQYMDSEKRADKLSNLPKPEEIIPDIRKTQAAEAENEMAALGIGSGSSLRSLVDIHTKVSAYKASAPRSFGTVRSTLDILMNDNMEDPDLLAENLSRADRACDDYIRSRRDFKLYSGGKAHGNERDQWVSDLKQTYAQMNDALRTRKMAIAGNNIRDCLRGLNDPDPSRRPANADEILRSSFAALLYHEIRLTNGKIIVPVREEAEIEQLKNSPSFNAVYSSLTRENMNTLVNDKSGKALGMVEERLKEKGMQNSPSAGLGKMYGADYGKETIEQLEKANPGKTYGELIAKNQVSDKFGEQAHDLGAYQADDRQIRNDREKYEAAKKRNGSVVPANGTDADLKNARQQEKQPAAAASPKPSALDAGKAVNEEEQRRIQEENLRALREQQRKQQELLKQKQEEEQKLAQQKLTRKPKQLHL